MDSMLSNSYFSTGVKNNNAVPISRIPGLIKSIKSYALLAVETNIEEEAKKFPYKVYYFAVIENIVILWDVKLHTKDWNAAAKDAIATSVKFVCASLCCKLYRQRISCIQRKYF